MDIKSIVSQLIKFLGSNPQLIAQFLSHPYSTTQQATGATSQLSSNDMGQVLTALAGLSSGQEVDYGNLAGIAAQLLGSNGGSAHSLASSLFGGTQAQATAAQAAQNNTSLDLGSLVSLAGLAGQLLGGGNSAPAATSNSAKPTSTPKPATASKPTSSTTTSEPKPSRPHKRDEAEGTATAKPTSSTSTSKPTAASNSVKPGNIDLSDGIDMNEAVTLASQLFGLGGKQ